jgi:predicted nucleotidyltransferase component of viral defense system
VFKGGTCLTKCYFGYYRFSEDLDFSYIPQHEFYYLSQKKIRKVLSAKINYLVMLLKDISDELGFDFKIDKSDTRYVELGGSNKFVTLKLWYNSELLDVQQFLKIQINFLEVVIEEIRIRTVRSLYVDIPEMELRLLFPDYIDIKDETSLFCYDLKELFFEKVRACLTRRYLKGRDFYDAYMIWKTENIDFVLERDKILYKIQFMLRYKKYMYNLHTFNVQTTIYEDIQKLLFHTYDEKDFKKFLGRYIPFLEDISHAVLSP